MQLIKIINTLDCTCTIQQFFIFLISPKYKWPMQLQPFETEDLHYYMEGRRHEKCSCNWVSQDQFLPLLQLVFHQDVSENKYNYCTVNLSFCLFFFFQYTVGLVFFNSNYGYTVYLFDYHKIIQKAPFSKCEMYLLWEDKVQLADCWKN